MKGNSLNINAITQILNSMIALIVALTFHEAAHALAASLQGDDTARREGRLTLNPIPHMDPLGTVFFPLLGLIAGSAIFGWAKPVPVDQRNLRYPRWGNVAVSLAGPFMNIVLCFLSLVALGLYYTHPGDTGPLEAIVMPFMRLAEKSVTINAILAAFNLIPLPPLDGGSVVSALLPDDLRERFENLVAPYAIFIILALSMTGGLRWVGHVAQTIIAFSQQAAFAVVGAF
jgi:Zn-dependent protease